MKITITQPEIEAAVRAHVLSQIQVKDPASITIDFTATRSEDGIVATINIPYISVGGLGNIAEAAPKTDSAIEANKAAPVAAKAAAAPKQAARATKPFADLQAPKAPEQNAAPATDTAETTTAAEAASDDKAPFAEGEPAAAVTSEAAPAESTTQKKSLFDFGMNR